MTIDGKTVYKASYTLTDDGLGDDDGVINNQIKDPVGAAVQAGGVGRGGAGGSGAVAVPTLSQWALYLLILILILALVGGRAHWLRKGKAEAS